MINYLRRRQMKNRVNEVFGNTLSGKRVFFVYLMLAVLGALIGFVILATSEEPAIFYDAVLTEGEAQVYDGDTLKDVRIKILDVQNPRDFVERPLWAGIYMTKTGIEVETDIRIAGIDTPEKRTSTKNADGTKRSEASRNRERAAAAASRQALIDLLKDNEFRMVIKNPQHGKYAGRTVADVIVIDENAAQYLIKQGHAKPYDGGTKPDWGWGK